MESRVCILVWISMILVWIFGFLVWIHVCGLWVVGCKKPNPRMNSCMETNIEYGTVTIEYGSLDFV